MSKADGVYRFHRLLGLVVLATALIASTASAAESSGFSVEIPKTLKFVDQKTAVEIPFTVTCAEESTLQLEVLLTQKAGRENVLAGDFLFIFCSGEVSDFLYAREEGPGEQIFRPGRATLDVRLCQITESECVTVVEYSQRVLIKPR